MTSPWHPEPWLRSCLPWAAADLAAGRAGAGHPNPLADPAWRLGTPSALG